MYCSLIALNSSWPAVSRTKYNNKEIYHVNVVDMWSVGNKRLLIKYNNSLTVRHFRNCTCSVWMKVYALKDSVRLFCFIHWMTFPAALCFWKVKKNLKCFQFHMGHFTVWCVVNIRNLSQHLLKSLNWIKWTNIYFYLIGDTINQNNICELSNIWGSM